MAITVIITQGTAFSTGGGTTASIATTGADAIFAIMTYVRPQSTPTLTDNKGNSYTALNTYEDTGSNGSVMAWRVTSSSPTVGTGHTFTTNANLGTLHIIAVSGARTATSPTDQQNGAFTGPGGFPSNPYFPGSISPSVADCLILTGVCQVAGALAAPTVPSSYTLIASFGTGTSFPGAGAYRILSGSAAQNPGWGVSTSANASANVVSFMPPAAAVTNHFFSLLGVGA